MSAQYRRLIQRTEETKNNTTTTYSSAATPGPPPLFSRILVSFLGIILNTIWRFSKNYKGENRKM